MKKLLIGFLILGSISAFAETELVCEVGSVGGEGNISFSGKAGSKINMRTKELEGQGKKVEILSVVSSTGGAATSLDSTERWRFVVIDRLCATLKY
ncbi:MAG: hypothetical protein ACOYL6_16695 [Bacteriovoracaceae bacterium]